VSRTLYSVRKECPAGRWSIGGKEVGALAEAGEVDCLARRGTLDDRLENGGHLQPLRRSRFGLRPLRDAAGELGHLVRGRVEYLGRLLGPRRLAQTLLEDAGPILLDPRIALAPVRRDRDDRWDEVRRADVAERATLILDHHGRGLDEGPPPLQLFAEGGDALRRSGQVVERVQDVHTHCRHAAGRALRR